jgi:hypothetical protein
MIVVNSVILLLKDGSEKFDLVDQGSIDKHLGLLIRDINLTRFEMSQPFLIQSIIDFLSLEEGKKKVKKLLLESHCSIRTLMALHKNTLGSIGLQLGCLAIFPIVFVLRYK